MVFTVLGIGLGAGDPAGVGLTGSLLSRNKGLIFACSQNSTPVNNVYHPHVQDAFQFGSVLIQFIEPDSLRKVAKGFILFSRRLVVSKSTIKVTQVKAHATRPENPSLIPGFMCSSAYKLTLDSMMLWHSHAHMHTISVTIQRMSVKQWVKY